MSFKDAITRTINPDADPANIAIEAVHSAQKAVEDCDTNGVELLGRLSAIEEQLGQAALAGDDNKAKELDAKIDDLQHARRINNAKRKTAQEHLLNAKIELHKIGVAGQLKLHRRTAALQKNTDELGPDISKMLPAVM